MKNTALVCLSGGDAKSPESGTVKENTTSNVNKQKEETEISS
ncbi:hypothetical protein AAH102_19455 [Bacteroides fragilis]|nr:hypothetical protein [Bacteroides fragilis]MCS2246873.1 hypothetical protein [Bacteroides fragilis]MCS2248131.1 hypothetical protein [Bacteroides fragilis]